MPVGLDHETKRISAFFSNLLAELGTQTATDTVAVCVAHVLSTAHPFITAVNQAVPVAVLLPKPKSGHLPTIRAIKKDIQCEVVPLNRDPDLPQRVVAALKKKKFQNKQVVLVDIGGYFAPDLQSLHDLIQENGGRLLGVMEGTENGAQLYEKHYGNGAESPVPVITVARSPLKLPEDHLVGAGIVFSIESILRKHNQILQTRDACVIGFGRIGSAVAAALRGRGIPTVIYDEKPVKMAEAAAQGYHVYANIHEAVERSSLIVSATSNAALTKNVLASIRNGAAVATVTSRDTEFAEKGAVLNENYEAVQLSPSNIVRWNEKGTQRYFWLLNDGDAPNFLDGAVLGPALQLIEGEKLAAITALARGEGGQAMRNSSLREIAETDRNLVAEVWIGHFLGIIARTKAEAVEDVEADPEELVGEKQGS